MESSSPQWISDANYLMGESMRLGAIVYPTYWAIKIVKRILSTI